MNTPIYKLRVNGSFFTASNIARSIFQDGTAISLAVLLRGLYSAILLKHDPDANPPVVIALPTLEDGSPMKGDLLKDEKITGIPLRLTDEDREALEKLRVIIDADTMAHVLRILPSLYLANFANPVDEVEDVQG